jgi:hypothetical protein
VFGLITILVALAVIGMGSASAQQPAGTATTPPMAPIKRTLLQKVDVPGSNYETVTGIAEIIPGVNVGRHRFRRSPSTTRARATRERRSWPSTSSKKASRSPRLRRSAGLARSGIFEIDRHDVAPPWRHRRDRVRSPTIGGRPGA